MVGGPCTDFQNNKYCYIECSNGYKQAPTLSQKTKITCTCTQANGCIWVPKKQWGKCLTESECPTVTKKYTSIDKVSKALVFSILLFQSISEL